MPSANVEIKARVADPQALERRVAEIADRGPEILVQEDVFFASPHGRLKLRKLGDGSAELIFYERDDAAGPTESRYVKSAATERASLEEALAGALGVSGVVRKTRRLYFAGRTRIHLDEVEGLGSFVELEVVLGEPGQGGGDEARELMRRLGIRETDLVSEAYVDLLESP